MGIVYAMAISNTSNRQSALSQAVSTCSDKDFDTAWGWADSLAAGKDRSTVFQSIFQSMGMLDPEKALEKFEALEDDSLKRKLEPTVLRNFKRATCQIRYQDGQKLICI